jgi:xylulose-5-phosphate/fructose-6-phosphate phosphoketolase
MKTKKDSEKKVVVKTKKKKIKNKPLSKKLLDKMFAYWRAVNYRSVGQLYLRDKPLLYVSLELSHIKSMLLGHWETTPGQNFIYVHVNRVIKSMIWI